MKNLKFYVQIPLCTMLILFSHISYGQLLLFEEVEEFGHHSHTYGGSTVDSYFYITERMTADGDCNRDKTIRLGFVSNYSLQKDDDYYEYEVLQYNDGVFGSIIASGIMKPSSFGSTGVSFFEEIQIDNNSTNTDELTTFVIEVEKLKDNFWFPNDATSSHFSLRWDYLPVDRTFSLNSSTVSAGDVANEEAEIFCNDDINGELMFALNQELTDALHCLFQQGPGLFSCNGQYGGLKITRTNSEGDPIDDTHYLGVQEWLDNEYSSVASSLKEATSFCDNCSFSNYNYNVDVVEVNLLEAFNDYMLNNPGFYLLEFEYFGECASFTEELWITFNTTPDLPIININIPNPSGPGFNNVPISGNTNVENPLISCETSAVIETIMPTYSLGSDLVILEIERFENTSPFSSEGIILDEDYTWNELGSGLTIVSELDGPDKWNSFGCMAGEDWQYLCDNLDKTYRVSITYQNECGVSESFVYYFTPSGASCKTSFSDDYVSKVNLDVYPNPTNGEINLTGFTNSKNVEVQVFDNSGKIHYTSNVSTEIGQLSEKINLDFLASGVYYIKFNNVNDIQHKKIIIH